MANNVNRSPVGPKAQGRGRECARRLRQVVTGRLDVGDDTLIEVAAKITSRVMAAEHVRGRRAAEARAAIDEAARRRR